MKNVDWNKLFAAVLLAALVAALSGFAAKKLVHPELPKTRAYVVEGVGQEVAAAPADAGPKAPDPISPLLAKASVEEGQKVARACQVCHSFEKGGPNKVGPNLWNIVGAPHAHIEGFAYSDVLKSMKDKPWDYEELSHFFYAPRAYAPGTKMAYAGLKKPEDRANLIAWLRTLSDQPAPLPQ